MASEAEIESLGKARPTIDRETTIQNKKCLRMLGEPARTLDLRQSKKALPDVRAGLRWS
jgi:hypothetical protein